MTARPRPYVRVYYEIADDPRFASIFDNDHHLAAWLRLLLTAEGAWPASAAMPQGARSSSVRALADAGLIEIVAGHRFRVHGLDAERQRRSDHARLSAEARWGSASRDATGTATGSATGNARLMLDTTRYDENTPSLADLVERVLDHIV